MGQWPRWGQFLLTGSVGFVLGGALLFIENQERGGGSPSVTFVAWLVMVVGVLVFHAGLIGAAIEPRRRDSR